MPRWHFICDESGNTGPDYKNQQQPFHVSAGWLFETPSMNIGREIVDEFASDGRELKGKQLMKSGGRTRALVTVFESLLDLGALPFFVAYERKFSSVGKLVDTFFDPFTNDAADWLPTSHMHHRSELAEWLYQDLPDALVEEFASAYRANEFEQYDRLLRKLSARTAMTGNRRLSATFMGALNNLMEIVETESILDFRSLHIGLNVPTLKATLELVDRLVAAREGGDVDVIHHHIDDIDQIFESLIPAFKAPRGVNPEFRIDRGKTRRLMLSQLGEIRTCSVEHEALLQLSDWLASAVARLLRDVWTGAGWTAEKAALAALLLPDLMKPRPERSGIWASSGLKEDLVKAMRHT